MVPKLMPPLSSRGARLHLGGASLQSLAQRFNVTGPSPQGPLYVYDGARIVSNAQRLQAALHDPQRRFSTRLYYAVKCNSNPAIVGLLRAQGLGADCSNYNEVRIARLAGVPASAILYSGNNNPAREIEQALQAGIAVNFDDWNLFERSSAGRPSRRGSSTSSISSLVSFRFNPGVGIGGHAKINTGGKDSKFGLDAPNLLRAYRLAYRRGARRFGLHMMMGSNTRQPALFVKQIGSQLKMAGRLCKELGIAFEFIDIGGGLGVPYHPDEKPLDIEWFGQAVRKAYLAGCQRHGVRGPLQFVRGSRRPAQASLPDLALEPGRIFLGDSAVILAQVTNVKRSFGRRVIGLEASMATLLRPALYDAYHHIYIDGKENGGRANADVVGTACENSDYFARARPMPANVAPGDLAVICTTGAYGFAMSSNYCNMPRPAEVLVQNKKAKLIRKRETFDDLVRLSQ